VLSGLVAIVNTTIKAQATHNISVLPKQKYESRSVDRPAISVFLVGATGYIRGSVLVGLKQLCHESTFTALVRNAKDVPKVEALGVRVINGSTDDVELVEKLANQHDVVVNCQNLDQLPLTEAILKGMLGRAKSGGGRRKPFLLHTRCAFFEIRRN
jgi:hypothetical protein